MAKWQDNAGLDALILLFLKEQKFGTTYKAICSHLEVPNSREVDQALQRLRKKGVIRYELQAWTLSPEVKS